MGRKEKIFTLRIDEVLLDYLKERAERNKRSIAKEIEFIVEQLYWQENRDFNKHVENFLNAMKQENCSPEDFAKIVADDSTNSPIKKAAVTLFKFLETRISD